MYIKLWKKPFVWLETKRKKKTASLVRMGIIWLAFLKKKTKFSDWLYTPKRAIVFLLNEGKENFLEPR